MSRNNGIEQKLLTVDVVAVDTTATGKTLATLLAVALDARLRKLVLKNQDAAKKIYFLDGSVTADPTAAGEILAGESIAIDATKDLADKLKFITTATTAAMLVIQEG